MGTEPLPLHPTLTRRATVNRAFLLVTALIILASPANGEGPEMTVYKLPTCGCCAKWVAYMKKNGVDVTANDIRGLTPIKNPKGVPTALEACHTALVGAYVIEGHVPAEDVKRLLVERPNATGLAVKGMPEGSPGMEGPN